MSGDVCAMVKALAVLDNIDISVRNSLYRQIHQSIQNYLQDYCKHSIVTDLIDIDPDRSENIRYCEHCMQTFD